MQKELRQRLLNKDAAGARSFLESLPRIQKGPAFEQFLELLYNGNGYKAVRQGGKGDGGADILLYEPSEEGVFCIIQAKNQTSPLTFDQTKTELRKFEDVASSEHGCNEFEIVSMNGFVKDAKELSRFRINLRDWDYVAGLIESYDPDSKSVPHIRLHAHNQIAFDAVMEGIEEGNKVACVQATGTGKSYVIGAVMNQFADEQKLLLAPSHYIIDQQSQVARWLNPSTEYKTYQSLPHLGSDEIKALNPSLILLDEFHRAGAEKWGDGVEKFLNAFPDAKVLGTTATPIRYLDSQRDMSDELFDMEAVNLPLPEAILRRILPSPIYISSLYTLREEANALLEDLEKSQRSDSEKATIKSEIDRAVIDWEKTSGVSEILKKHLGDRKCKKFVVFCKDIKHLNELEDEVRKWFRKTGLFEDRESYRVYSGYKKSDANYKRFLAADDDSTAHILLAVDMLNEGIHASDIDAVLLFRPTTSPRIFYQQIGRCLQVGSKNNPIIFDFVNNFQSIRANDFLSDLEEASEKEREIRSRFGLDVDHLPELQVHDESKDVLKTFEEIENRLGTWEIRFEELVAYKQEHGNCLVPRSYKKNQKLASWVSNTRVSKKRGSLDQVAINRLDAIGFTWNVSEQSWWTMFKLLTAYAEQNGDTNVPQRESTLGQWVRTQRRAYGRKQLDKTKIKSLDEIGFTWDEKSDRWQTMFNELISYKDQHGHCNVPSVDKDRSALFLWLCTQRTAMKDGKIEQDRIDKLNAIGFIWDLHEHMWQERFNQLLAFKEKHGHCNVPLKYTQNKTLGSFVIGQRYKQKNGNLPAHQIEQLNAIGFIWDLNEHLWQEKFNQLLAFKEKHGHCNVPQKYTENKALGSWVCGQRERKRGKKKRASPITQHQIQRLEEIGFIWNVHEHEWEKNFKQLVSIKKENGLAVIKHYGGNRKIQDWVHSQRRLKREGKLPRDKVDRLDAIGIVWDPRST